MQLIKMFVLNDYTSNKEIFLFGNKMLPHLPQNLLEDIINSLYALRLLRDDRSEVLFDCSAYAIIFSFLYEMNKDYLIKSCHANGLLQPAG
jgi:hypothetical protein